MLKIKILLLISRYFIFLSLCFVLYSFLYLVKQTFYSHFLELYSLLKVEPTLWMNYNTEKNNK